MSVNRFRALQESVARRGEACALAAHAPQRAFDLARTIPDGWYRCQAMAAIAAQADAPLAETAFAAARAAAAAGGDHYQRAAALAFAIAPALRRGRSELARAMLDDALALVPEIEPMASRAHALHLLWSAAAHGDGAMRRAALAALQAHVHPDRSWRARRLYRDVAERLDRDNPGEAEGLLCAMPPGKSRAWLRRRLAADPPAFPGP